MVIMQWVFKFYYKILEIMQFVRFWMGLREKHFLETYEYWLRLATVTYIQSCVFMP